MPPTFQVNNFKPWVPPRRKPFSPHRSPNSRSERTSNSPYPKPCHESLPSTRPFLKHHLPVRPPAEVCMHLGTNTRPCAPFSTQNQTEEIPAELPNAPRSENSKHGTTSQRELSPQTPHVSTPDRASHYDSREITEIPTELPCFPGDITEAVLLLPTVSSLDDVLEKIFQLPDIQSTISIDPAILANDGCWEASDQHQPVPRCDSAILSETICPYPEPPPLLDNVAGGCRDYSKSAGSRNNGIHKKDHSHTYAHQEMRPFNHDAEPDPAHSNNVSEQSKSSKRKR